MFSTRLYTLVFLAVGIAVEAVPAPVKRSDATPALEARAPQFSANIPNNIPVSGTFPNGITITPQTPSGSIVTGNNNSTLFGAFGFKRDDASVEARQFNFTLHNQLPVEGVLPFGLSVTQGAQNSTVGLPAGFPFKRGLEARQFNFTLHNQLPVEGILPFGLSVTKGTQNSTVGLPAGFPFKRDGATPALAAREPQFSANIPNNIPVSGKFPNGITITPGTPSGSIVTGDRNSTLFGFLPFKRDSEARQFNFTLPNRLPVQGVLPFGLSVTQGAQNSTVGLPAGFPFKRDLEARQFNFTLHNQLPVEGVLPFGLTVTQGAQNSTVGLPAGFPF
ncbi:hypothetical protein PENSPDRAFT_756398 [Peniophora sp. CONT]|nr:hypothetical protein PENSPDRAFT_756398 [Peniophora sp. CONT]